MTIIAAVACRVTAHRKWSSRSAAFSIISLTLLSSLLIALNGDHVSGQGNQSRGSQLAKERKCVACHDASGFEDSPNAPYIDGQKISILTRELQSFAATRSLDERYRVSERRHSYMDPMSSSLTDSDIRDLAEYYSSLDCVPRRSFKEADVPVPALARRCQYCHGATGVNPFTGVPNIAGQKKDYMVEEFKSFRAASALDFPERGTLVVKNERYYRAMEPSMYDLTDKDLDALAQYYSSQSCR